MKKRGVLGAFFLMILLCTTAIFAATDNTTTDTTTDTSSSPSLSATTESPTVSVSGSGDSVGTLGNLSQAFQCLEEKVGADCAQANTVQELALTILATPDNVMQACIQKLEAKRNTDGSFGSLRDTGIAVIALEHAGKDTTESENWIKSKQMNPTDIVWFLQEDSDGLVGCKFDDGTTTYEITIDENKKISSDAGTCLRRAQSNFWYQISPDCYTTLFKISCDKDFITNLLYKSRLSSTIYVLEDTKQSPAFGTTEHRVNSKCLGSGSCDYEGTLWAAFALQVTGHEIDEYIPYLIASSDTKKQYLPNAFIYILTGYENYATRLIQEQRFGSYWEADSSSYNRYYDTALALLGLGTGQEQTARAKDWLLFEQGTNGCWGNSIRETAFILWVLLQKDYYTEPTTVFCEEAGFFCVENSFCSSDNDLGDETYYCSGTTRTCCRERETRTCFELGGAVCAQDQACLGFESEASDTPFCCVAGCGDLEPQTTECEENYYSCFDSCAEGYADAGYSCNTGQVCCRPDTTPEESSGLPWWIWLLIALIIIAIIAILFVYRDKIKEKFSKEDKDTKENQGGPGIPPRRPGFPPRRGPPGRPMRRGPPGRPMRRGPPGRPPLRGPPRRPTGP